MISQRRHRGPAFSVPQRVHIIEDQRDRRTIPGRSSGRRSFEAKRSNAGPFPRRSPPAH